MNTFKKSLKPEDLERFGPSIKVRISNPKKTELGAFEGIALVDTGSTKTQIEVHYFEILNPERVSMVLASNSSEQHKIKETYGIHISFPELDVEGDFEVTFATMTATKASREEAVIAVLGRDFLSKCKLIYDGKGEYQIEIDSN